MAERRMFAKTITEADKFNTLSHSAQVLYFHLSMNADDDGFCNIVNRLILGCQCSEDELKALIDAGYIILFESGVVAITHWKQHNRIQKDRYTKTDFAEEKASLIATGKGVYEKCVQNVSKMDTDCIQNGHTGKDRLGKDRLGKDNKGEEDSSLSLLFPNINCDEEFKKVVQLWGKASPYRLTEQIAEELSVLSEEFGADNVCAAIKAASEQCKVSIAYIKGILRNKAAGSTGGGTKSQAQKEYEKRKAELEAIKDKMRALDEEEARANTKT